MNTQIIKRLYIGSGMDFDFAQYIFDLSDIKLYNEVIYVDELPYQIDYQTDYQTDYQSDNQAKYLKNQMRIIFYNLYKKYIIFSAFADCFSSPNYNEELLFNNIEEYINKQNFNKPQQLKFNLIREEKFCLKYYINTTFNEETILRKTKMDNDTILHFENLYNDIQNCSELYINGFFPNKVIYDIMKFKNILWINTISCGYQKNDLPFNSFINIFDIGKKSITIYDNKSLTLLRSKINSQKNEGQTKDNYDIICL